MIGRGAYETPTSNCPWCGLACEADWVDVGVGMVQCGPYHCDFCLASEIGPNDQERELSESENKNGWYAPGAETGSSANVIGGKIVTAKQMNSEYRKEFIGNPLYDVPRYVEDWFEKTRKGLI